MFKYRVSKNLDVIILFIFARCVLNNNGLHRLREYNPKYLNIFGTEYEKKKENQKGNCEVFPVKHDNGHQCYV